MVFTRRSKPPVELADPLPRCDGPKLKFFGHHSSSFNFVSLLSSENPGQHGHVFEVVLDSQRYALKIASSHMIFLLQDGFKILTNQVV